MVISFLALYCKAKQAFKASQVCLQTCRSQTVGYGTSENTSWSSATGTVHKQTVYVHVDKRSLLVA